MGRGGAEVEVEWQWVSTNFNGEIRRKRKFETRDEERIQAGARGESYLGLNDVFILLQMPYEVGKAILNEFCCT